MPTIISNSTHELRVLEQGALEERRREQEETTTGRLRLGSGVCIITCSSIMTLETGLTIGSALLFGFCLVSGAVLIGAGYRKLRTTNKNFAVGNVLSGVAGAVIGSSPAITTLAIATFYKNHIESSTQ